MSNAVLSAGLKPTTSMTMSAPRPSVTSLILEIIRSLSVLKLSGSAPKPLASSRRLSILSIANRCFGLYSSAEIIAHSPTGPQPITTAVASDGFWAPKALKAFLAPKNPVGKMSAIRINALSSIPGGAFVTVPSARGTRTYSAWPPYYKSELLMGRSCEAIRCY